jgi:hypothetical protein
MEIRALEEQERAAYARLPQTESELLPWDPEAVWLRVRTTTGRRLSGLGN